MSRSNDQLTSTEKLLELIRSGNNDAIPRREEHTACRVLRFPGFNTSSIFHIAKTPTAGVDIDRRFIRMVKMVRMPDGQWHVLKKESVKLPEGVSRRDPEFAGFLKNALTQFRGASGKMNLWASVSTSGADVRHILIPKVSKNQIETAVYWTVRKEAAFDEKQSVFDFMIQGEVMDQGVPKWSVMVYTAPRSEVEELQELFFRSGFPLSGITIAPLALQNYFRTKWLPFEGNSIASLFIGNNFSRISIFAEGNLVMTRRIKAGINSMLESLQEKLSEEVKVCAGEGEEVSVTSDRARKLLFSLGTASSFEERIGEHGPSQSEIFTMILPAINRLIQQVERTFEYHEANAGYDRVKKLYISSIPTLHPLIVDYIGDHLGVELHVLDPLGRIGTPADSTFENDLPSERIAFILAFGLALSDMRHTPNFIFTFHDKEKQARLARVNKLIATGFLAALSLCAAVFIHQGHLLKVGIAQRDRLTRELARFTPRLDQAEMTRMALTLNGSRPDSDRYLAMALISELSAITPYNVQLFSIRANLERPSKTKAGENRNAALASADPGSSKAVRLMEVEGMIDGERKMLESLLAQYVMKLDASPLFGEISVQRNDIESLGRNDILHFTLNAKIT